MSSIPWLFKFTLLHCRPKSLNHVKQIHALLLTTGLKTPSILANLIQHCCSLSPHQIPNHAHLIVNHEQHNKVFLLNTLIKCSQPTNSILLFAQWVSNPSIDFDDHTFIFALGACARNPSLSGLYEGRQILCRALKHGFMLDLLVATTAIHFYGSNGCICDARKVFDEMPVRSNVTWNALLTGYSSQKENSGENSVKALMFFKDMLSADVRPNGTTMVSVLSAASQLGAIEIGSCIHGFVVKTIDASRNDVYVGTCLVDMYCKCGCLDIAQEIFFMMKQKNVLTWTAMITGLAYHGKGKEAMELLDQMKENKIIPNAVTFTSVLSACCHAGLLQEGLQLFYNMEEGFGVVPRIEHYGCIVDLLGRAGNLNDAYDLIINMPIKPEPILWRSLLGSCRLHGDTELGERVGKILLRVQPNVHIGDVRCHSEDYIGLSNVYALAGRWVDVGTVRKEMSMRGVGIKPGGSAV